MMRLNLVCLMLLFILKMQCLQLQRHQVVQHDQTQVLVGLGGMVGSAFVTDKLKIVYFLLLLFLAILILRLVIQISIEQFFGPLSYNVGLSKVMQKVEKNQMNLTYISSKLNILNKEDKKKLKLKLPLIDREVEDDQAIKITKKIEVMQWRQAIDSMELFKKNQITIYGLLNYFTNLQWVDKNEGIKGGKINDPNNWKLKNESQWKNMTIKLQILCKNGTIDQKQLLTNADLQLLSNYNQGQIIKLNLKEEDKEKIINKIKNEIKSSQNQQIRVSFDENYIYLLPQKIEGESQCHGSLRISFQKLKAKQAINFVAIYDEKQKKIKKYNDFQFDIIIGQTLTKEEYFHQLYWRKNSGRILLFIQIGVIVTLGIIIGIFAFKVVITDNQLLNSVCRAHNLFMGFIFIYNTVWLIFAITEVNFMIYCYWNLISKKQIVLMCLSIIISSWIIIDLIRSKESHDAWKELHKAYHAQS